MIPRIFPGPKWLKIPPNPRSITSSFPSLIFGHHSLTPVSRSLSCLRVTPSYKTDFYLKLPTANTHIITFSDQLREAAKLCTQEEKKDMLFFCIEGYPDFDVLLSLIKTYEFDDSVKLEAIKAILKGCKPDSFHSLFLKRHFSDFKIKDPSSLKTIANWISRTYDTNLLFILKDILKQIPEDKEFKLDMIKQLTEPQTGERALFFLYHLPEFHKDTKNLEILINNAHTFDPFHFFEYAPGIIKTLDQPLKIRLYTRICQEGLTLQSYFINGVEQKYDRFMSAKNLLNLFKQETDPEVIKKLSPYLKKILLLLTKSPSEESLSLICECIKLNSFELDFKTELIKKIINHRDSLTRSIEFLLDHAQDFFTNDPQSTDFVCQIIAKKFPLQNLHFVPNNDTLLKFIGFECLKAPIFYWNDFILKIHKANKSELFSSVIMEGLPLITNDKRVEPAIKQIANYKGLPYLICVFFFQGLINELSHAEKLHIMSAFCQFAEKRSADLPTPSYLLERLSEAKSTYDILEILKRFDLNDQGILDTLQPYLEKSLLSAALSDDPTALLILYEFMKTPHLHEEFKEKIVQNLLKDLSLYKIDFTISAIKNYSIKNPVLIDLIYQSIAISLVKNYGTHRTCNYIHDRKDPNLVKAVGLASLKLGKWSDFTNQLNPNRDLRSSIILEGWKSITDEKNLEPAFKELAKYRNSSIANTLTSIFFTHIQNKKYTSIYTTLASIKAGNTWQLARIKTLPLIYPALWLSRLASNDVENGYKACEQISSFLYSPKVKKYIENEVKYPLLQDFLTTCIAMNEMQSSNLERLLILSGFCNNIENPAIDHVVLSRDLKLIPLIYKQGLGPDLYEDFIEKGHLELGTFYQNVINKFLHKWQCDQIENAAENYAKSFGQTKIPYSVMTYARNCSLAAKEDLTRFIHKTLEGTVRQERYRTDINPNLAQLQEQSPELFNQWKELDVEIKTEKLLAKVEDDPLLLFEIPTIIGGSCLALNGAHKECLLAYCLDGTVKMITVQGGNVFTARSVLRVLFDEKMKPFLLLEPLYYKDSQDIETKDAQDAVIKIADKAAEKLNLPLFVRYKGILNDSATSVNWKGGPCASFYSDALGGSFPKGPTTFTALHLENRSQKTCT